jgi:hypothetical protein
MRKIKLLKLVHWKKVAYGAFFKPSALLPPAKDVAFAGCFVRMAAP